jgi:type IV pilus assembly protein PilA
MQCRACGARNVDYDLACAHCGRLLDASAAEPAGTRARPPRAPRSSGAATRPGTVALLVAICAAVPVAGLVAAIAIPAYRDYAVRAQVAEGVALAEPLEGAVVAAWRAAGGRFDGVYSETLGGGLKTSGKYVRSVDVIAGAIVIAYGERAVEGLAGRTLTIVPALDPAGTAVEWQCGRGAPPPGFEPIFDEPSRLTDVPDRYLPPGCAAR